jgi:hypothetical protein
MLVTHELIGIGEGIITGVTVVAVVNARPTSCAVAGTAVTSWTCSTDARQDPPRDPVFPAEPLPACVPELPPVLSPDCRDALVPESLSGFPPDRLDVLVPVLASEVLLLLRPVGVDAPVWESLPALPVVRLRVPATDWSPVLAPGRLEVLVAERPPDPALAALDVLTDWAIAGAPDRRDVLAVEPIGVPTPTDPRSNPVGGFGGGTLPAVGMVGSEGNSAGSPVPGRDPPELEGGSRIGICGVPELENSTMVASGFGVECGGPSGVSGRSDDAATSVQSARSG